MRVGPLDYNIGLDYYAGKNGHIIEVGYDQTELPRHGLEFWRYGNLFNEKYEDQNEHERAHFGPYLHDSDTAQQYDEGQIDPKGPGWKRNLDQQIEAAHKGGFKYIELDNPDAYHAQDVVDALSYVAKAGLMVIAKNPLLVEGDHLKYLAHPAVVSCVVEKGAGTTDGMEQLRRSVGKPLLPIFFVSHVKDKGLTWVKDRAAAIKAKGYKNMGASYSPMGEYCSSVQYMAPEVQA
jgi:hypothetical protein